MDFGKAHDAWIYRRLSFSKETYWQSLTICLNRFTAVGTAAMLKVGLHEVQRWRTGRYRPRPYHQASIVWLARVSTKAIEDLEDEILGRIPLDSGVDQPVKAPKRTRQVVYQNPS